MILVLGLMLSFDYGGKKARDVDFTCRCHLSNIMSDSTFYDSMVITTFLLIIKEMDSVVFGMDTSGLAKTLNYNVLRQM